MPTQAPLSAEKMDVDRTATPTPTTAAQPVVKEEVKAEKVDKGKGKVVFGSDGKEEEAKKPKKEPAWKKLLNDELEDDDGDEEQGVCVCVCVCVRARAYVRVCGGCVCACVFGGGGGGVGGASLCVCCVRVVCVRKEPGPSVGVFSTSSLNRTHKH